MATVQLKVGDSISCVGTYKDAEGNPVNLDDAGITVTSKVLTPDGETRHELEVTPSDQSTNPGEFIITGSTAEWEPHKGYRWDVRYTNSGGSWSSDSVCLDLGEQVS